MTVRDIALTLLDSHEASGKYINLSLSSHITDSLTPTERALLTSLLYTTVERRLTIDYYVAARAERSLDSLDSHTLNILRLGVAQLVFIDSVPDFAAVNETVKLARNKGERALVNGILRRLSRDKADGCLPTPDRAKNLARFLSVTHSFPLPLVRHFIGLFGEEKTERMLESFNTLRYTDLTVNLQRISREELISLIRDAGYQAYPSPHSPLTVRIDGSVLPTKLPGFAEGLFFVEDTASAFAVSALGISEGDKVIDACAAPGGKSFAAAILAGESGEVHSYDIHESKLSLIESGAKRLGLSTVKVGLRDATKPNEELFGCFDRVICDAPCSGLGVLGKKADIRYRSLDSLDELSALQYDILCASANYLKIGGTLVYSTCTLSKGENEGVVERFLAERGEFALSPFTVGDLHAPSGMLTLTPDEHSTDGFFIAKLTKVQ